MKKIPSEMIKKVENEFYAVETGAGWPMFLHGIRSESSNLPYEFSEAKKLQNKKLNRYQDVNPYDHSRIILESTLCDYINASLVSVVKADRKYILAQGPLPHTTSHFWLMIWQQDSRAIIMLNRVIEKNMVKCHQYWPVSNEESMLFEDVGLKVTNISEEKASYYTITKLNLLNIKTEQNREVVHFHYTTWPDFGCPQSPTAFLRFLALVRSSGVLDRTDQPAVVHCSAGIGRSGTFCLVDSCLRMMEELGLDNVVVREVLVEMRHFRMGLVQTADQLRFSYLAILEGLKTDSIVNGNVTTSSHLVEELIEDEEEAPPLPPPRGESLRLRTTHDRTEEVEDVSQRKKDRDEKREKLKNKVEEIKDNIKKTEHWHGIHRSLIRPVSIAALLVLGGCAFYTYISSRG